tara:strand:+ start:10197 stop:10499 length:303 start_codon:yes stop_codon:yes gene_type:complete
MFLKKKEKDPNWDKKKEWEWELQGAQHRPPIVTGQNYLGGVFVQDPSRHAQLVPSLDEMEKIRQKNIQHEERRKLVLQAHNKKGLRGLLGGIGDKLFGEW